LHLLALQASGFSRGNSRTYIGWSAASLGRPPQVN